jgi:acyl-CoA reductase-like NAD-dependent aldehyde dehydrogenase
MMHVGQRYGLTKRTLVPQSRYGELVEAITEAIKVVPYGDPTDPSTISAPRSTGTPSTQFMADVMM